MDNEKICRICFETNKKLINPCKCSGTSKWIHDTCLYQWINTHPVKMTKCQICNTKYNFKYYNKRKINKIFKTILNYPRYCCIIYMFTYIIINIFIIILDQHFNFNLYNKYKTLIIYNFISYCILFISQQLVIIYSILVLPNSINYIKSFPINISSNIILFNLGSFILCIFNLFWPIGLLYISLILFIKFHLVLSKLNYNLYGYEVLNYQSNNELQ